MAARHPAETTSIHRAGLRAAGAQPVRRPRLSAAADPGRDLAEPVPVGPAGTAALCRPGQLAVGARRRRLRELAGRHDHLRGDRGPGADGARAAGRDDAGPPASGHRPVSHAVCAAVDLRARWRSRCCGAGSWLPPTARSAPCWGIASNGCPIPAWRCRSFRRSSSGPTSATSRCLSWRACWPSPTTSTPPRAPTAPMPGSDSGASPCPCCGRRCSSCWSPESSAQHRFSTPSTR